MSGESGLVGAAEAAEILGCPVPVVTRYKDEGRMPPPAAEKPMAASPVWWRQDVLDLLSVLERHDDWRLLNWKDHETVDVVGTDAAAKLLKVDKSQIGRWRRDTRDGKARVAFPEPFDQLRSGPLWLREQIVEFNKSRPKRKKRSAA